MSQTETLNSNSSLQPPQSLSFSSSGDRGRPDRSSRALSLLAPLAEPAVTFDDEWRVAFSNNGAGAESGYALPDFDDSSWESVRLPHLKPGTAAGDTLWYRYRFNLQLPITTYHLLRFGGAFYYTTVWLNGTRLGEHEGYFQPFGFDVTDRLRPGENVLAVRCRLPVEAGAFKRKTAVVGIFADWDCKPYPSAFYPSLPPPNEWVVPVGLWQPVSLREIGPALVESFNVFPEVISPRWPDRSDAPGADAARLRCVVQLRNLTAAPLEAHARIEVAPHDFEGDAGVHGNWPLSLPPGQSRRFEFDLTLPQPRLWFPWTHGEPSLYRADLSISNPQSPISTYHLPLTVHQTFGIRAVEAEIGPGRWEWSLNGRRIFPKGSNYAADFYLDRATAEGLRRDVELAKGANLDLLRVHAHIAPHDFYRLCDELGVMVMCDFPLIWTYGHNLPEAEAEAFRASVHRQVEDMIHLLGSHPSVVLWSMHNEPPWTPDGSSLGKDLHQSETNRDLDEASADLARRLDPTRPSIPASGMFDQHLYHGWYTEDWRHNRNLSPPFPTEFGVQALPNLDSPFWATVNNQWPVEADDPTWAHAGYQTLFWASPGVGVPSQFASLAHYVEASQAYQAHYIRYTIDQWRRKKFRPVGGYVHFLLTDLWPAITWSVLDYFRKPKAGYEVLAEASRPVRICLDLEDGWEVEHAYQIVFPVGATLRLCLYLVNDDYRLGGEVKLRWWLERRERGKIGAAFGRWWSRWRARRGTVRLPPADEGAQLIRLLRFHLPRAGDYEFRVETRQGRRVLDENRLSFRVGSPRRRARPPRRVPGILVSRVYQSGSLRHAADGFTFALRNPAMPVTFQRLVELSVDGIALDSANVEIVCGGLSRRASTITPHAPLEIPSGENFSVLVREYRLAPGPHEIEFTAEFFGLGEISARIEDRLL